MISAQDHGYRLALAGIESAAEIARLHAQLFDPPWSEPSIRALCEALAVRVLVARDRDSALEGFIIVQVVADEAEILSIGVAASAQRRGLGEQLMRRAGEIATGEGARQLFLDVADDNTSALALYRRCGFRETGRRKSYYARQDGAPADALLMVAVLPFAEGRHG